VDHDVGQCIHQVRGSDDNGERALSSMQPSQVIVNPADPATASAACLQSPGGDGDDTIITSQDDNVDMHDEVLMCATTVSTNDGE